MKANNPDVHSMDAVLDKLYGAVGTPERDEFRKEAAAYCVGQIISDARKHEGMTRLRPSWRRKSGLTRPTSRA